MTTTQTPEEIAKRLSPAQRRKLKYAHAGRHIDCRKGTGKVLVRLGLAEARYRTVICATGWHTYRHVCTDYYATELGAAVGRVIDNESRRLRGLPPRGAK